MAQFNFPNSPNNGDSHTQNGITFVWDGEAYKELLVHKVHKVLKVLQDQVVQQVLKVLLVEEDQQVLKVPKEPQEMLLLVLKVQRDQQVLRVLKVIQEQLEQYLLLEQECYSNNHQHQLVGQKIQV